MTDLGARRAGESGPDFVDRRGREAAWRAAAFDARVAARRAAGIADVPCALPPAFEHSRDWRENINGIPFGERSAR